jgi:hypothetical protein
VLIIRADAVFQKPPGLSRMLETGMSRLPSGEGKRAARESRLSQLLQAKTGRRSEQLSREQLALFATELGITLPETEDSADDHDQDPPAGAAPSEDLRKIGEEVSERYEYLPAQMKVIEDTCLPTPARAP